MTGADTPFRHTCHPRDPEPEAARAADSGTSAAIVRGIMAPINTLSARTTTAPKLSTTVAATAPSRAPATSPAVTSLSPDSFVRATPNRYAAISGFSGGISASSARLGLGSSAAARFSPDKAEIGAQKLDPTTIRTGNGDDDVTIARGFDMKIHVIVNGKEAWAGTEEEFKKMKLDTGAGNDKVTNYVNGSRINTGSGNDTVLNVASGAMIDLGSGDDRVTSRGNNNMLEGGKGNDVLGSVGNGNGIFGSDGDDQLDSTGNDNLLLGGRGVNRLSSHGDRNRVNG